jgi:hypothetical protein
MRRGILAVIALALSTGTAIADSPLGVQADVGLPDGGGVALVVRPISRVRIHAGAGHNGIAPGMRAGLTLAPLRTWFSPIVAADIGRYREGDIPMFEGNRAGYEYAAGRVGIEIGRERVTFFLHGGVSRVWGRVSDEDSGAIDLTVTSVSARLGFILFL